MNGRHQILIVTQTPALANDLRAWLSAHGYWITAADTYGAAKFQLEMQPSMVITRAQARRIQRSAPRSSRELEPHPGSRNW